MTDRKLAKFLDVIAHSVTLISIVLIPLFVDRSLINFYIIPKQYVFSGLILLNVLIWSVKAIFSGAVQFRHSVISWPVYVILMVAGLSSVFSVNSQTSFFGRSEYYVISFFSLAFFVLYYFLLTNQLSSKALWKRSVDFLVLGGVLSGSVYLLRNFAHIEWLNNLLGNASNTIENSGSVFATYIVALLVLSAGRLISKNNSIVQDVLNGLSTLVLMLVLISLSYSFVWWILLVGLVFLLILGIGFIKESRLWWLSGLFASLLIVGIFIVFGQPRLLQTNLSTEISLGAKPSWNISVSTIFSGTKNFILGSGPGTFNYDFSKFRTSLFNSDPVAWSLRFNHPINTLFAFVAEFGMIFSLLFVFLILFYFGHVLFVWYKMKMESSLRSLTSDLSWKKHDIRQDVFLVAITWLVTTIGMIFVFVGFVGWWLWWLLLALGVSGLGFINSDIVRDVEWEVEDTPQYSLAFSFTMIMIIAAVVLSSVLGVRSYAAEVNYVAALNASNTSIAERAMRQAIDKKGSYDIFHTTMAQIYLAEASQLSKISQPDMTTVNALVAKAVNEAKMATDISPESIVVWENMATMYENAAVVVPEARDWAIKSLLRSRELEPSSAILPWRLGNNYLQSGKTDEAIKLYREAIKLKADYLGAYIGLAIAHEQGKQIDKAIDVYKVIFNQAMENPEYLYNFGRLLYNRNTGQDRLDAEKLWQKAIALAPKYSDALYSLGMLYEKKGATSLALEYYNQVKDLNPDNKDIVAKIRSLTSGAGVTSPKKSTKKK